MSTKRQTNKIPRIWKQNMHLYFDFFFKKKKKTSFVEYAHDLKVHSVRSAVCKGCGPTLLMAWGSGEGRRFCLASPIRGYSVTRQCRRQGRSYLPGHVSPLPSDLVVNWSMVKFTVLSSSDGLLSPAIGPSSQVLSHVCSTHAGKTGVGCCCRQEVEEGRIMRAPLTPEPRGTEVCFCVLRGTVIIMTLFLKNKQTDKKGSISLHCNTF